jgi:hypothetical protein
MLYVFLLFVQEKVDSLRTRDTVVKIMRLTGKQ